MENRFRLRFCRIFQASFFSCRSRKLSDTVEKPIPLTRKLRNFLLIEETSNRSRKTRPETTAFSGDGNGALRRRKVSERFSPFLAPPAPPVSPRDCLFREKKKKNPEKIKRKKTKPKKKTTDCAGAWWYSTDEDDDETETLFSSRSLTSDSSATRRRRRAQSRKNGCRRSTDTTGGIPVKGSFAVVKNSSDPYKDFRASMVEMIVEKKMFREGEVEQLLQCFLSLNSHHYHKVIFQVYAEIREALLICSDLGFTN